jgi:hypothetical protein
MTAGTSRTSRPPLPVRAVLYAANTALKSVRHRIQRARVGWRNYRYRARSSRTGRAAWRLAAFAQAPRETRERQRAAAAYTAGVQCAEMSPGDGFCLLEPAYFPDVGRVLAICRELCERKLAAADAEGAPGVERDGQLKVRAAKREHLRNLLDNEDLREHPELVDFALSEAAMGTAARYLGTIPYLNRVDLLYSVPRTGDEKVSSQLFHVDPEGLSQVKFFVNVHDVGEAEGPFTFIPAAETARIVQEVSAMRRHQGKALSGRYLDDEIAAVGGRESIVRVMGTPGSAMAVDTSRCLHMGSRVLPGAFRLCLYLQYCSSRERGNAFDVDRYRDDAVRTLALRHSLSSAGAGVSAPHQMDPAS